EKADVCLPAASGRNVQLMIVRKPLPEAVSGEERDNMGRHAGWAVSPRSLPRRRGIDLVIHLSFGLGRRADGVDRSGAPVNHERRLHSGLNVFVCEDATLQIGFLGWHWGMGRGQVSRSVRRLSGKGVQAAITANRNAARKTSVTAGIQ